MPSEDPFEYCALFQPLTYRGAEFHARCMASSTGLFGMSHKFSQFCVVFAVKELELVCGEVGTDLCEGVKLLLNLVLL